MRPLLSSALAALLAATSLTAFAPAPATPAAPSAATVPDEVPDRGPLLSEPMRRGEVVLEDVAPRTPAVRTIDGDPSDWIGEPTRIGGTSRFDAGEHVYSDFVHDAWGADDGTDRERSAVLGPVAAAEPRTTRMDALFQALGAQFGAPDPVGADEAYGDELANDVADITTVRWGLSPDGASLELAVEVSNLTDADDLGVVVLAQRLGPPVLHQAFGVEDLYSLTYDQGVLLTADGAWASPLETGLPERVTDAEVAVDASGWTNTLEARLPVDLLTSDGTFHGTVVAGVMGPVLPGDPTMGFSSRNVAYRTAEPVAGMYNDQRQAYALADGHVDDFAVEFELADLAAGRTQSARPGPGYHERTFRSDPGISAEFREGLDDVYEDTVWQRYALFVPSDHDPSEDEQLTFWLHYRGGKAHSGGAWSPRLFTQLGEEVGGLVVTPHGRGERRWYEGSSHQDFWEVYEDVHATFDVDPARRYLSGYSMGGHGSPMMGLLYPDRFAGVYTQAGAIGRDLFPVAVNGRHQGTWIDVSAQDGLVAVNRDFAAELSGLGHRHVLQVFTAGEHYTQAILDEWAAGARYLQQFETPANPRDVTFRLVPSLVETINDGRGEPTSRSFTPDGAWWVDGLVAADGAAAATVEAVARTLPGDDATTVLDLGDVQPGDHSVPSVRTGTGWATSPAAVEPAVDVALTGAAAVTLDAGRWDLVTATTLTVDTDGPTRVTLVGLDGGSVVVDGAPVPVVGGTAVLALPAGTSVATLTPAG